MTKDEWDTRLVRHWQNSTYYERQEKREWYPQLKANNMFASYVEGIHWNIDELYYDLQK